MQRNVATLRHIDLYIPLKGYVDSPTNPKEKIKLDLKPLYDVWEGRDKYIQNLMRIIEERLEKCWKLPWSLVGIIHSFMWDREDLSIISSKGIRNYSEEERIFTEPLVKIHYYRKENV